MKSNNNLNLLKNSVNWICETMPRNHSGIIEKDMGIKSISVVMPVYNEAKNIDFMLESILQTIPKLTTDYEVIFVNDGSLDETPQLIKSLIKRFPQVRLMEHELNRGYGAAVFTGLCQAQKSWIFLTDSDRQFDLTEILKMLALIRQNEIIAGYRSPRRDPLIRRLNGWGWSLVVGLLFGYLFRDIDCAFKLIKFEVMERLKDDLKSQGAAFSAELLIRAKRAGFRVQEVPIHGHRPRVAGRPTGGRFDVILRAFRELVSFRIALWLEARRAGKKI